MHLLLYLQSCTNVALDFVSPENVSECIHLTEELRSLPKNHSAKEDKLEVGYFIISFCSVIWTFYNGVFYSVL